MNESWIGIEEIASHLDMKPSTVRTWAKSGKIPSKKIGRHWKFRVSEVDAWVECGKSAMGNDGLLEGKLTNGRD